MTRIALLFAGLVGLAACTPNGTTTGGGQGTSAVTPEQLYRDVCAGCHGNDGTGNGEFAAALLTRPTDLTTISLRNGGVFPRNQVLTILDGYERGAHFSEAIERARSAEGGGVIVWDDGSGFGAPVPAQLNALANYLQSIQRQ